MGQTTLILGASGIVGQHLMLQVPPSVYTLYAVGPTSNRMGIGEISINLNVWDDVEVMLNSLLPDVIINLAGESSPDRVEKDPDKYFGINVDLPIRLAKWCSKNNSRLIQVSTQAVFNGEDPPYHPYSEKSPINEYGKQKDLAELGVLNYPKSAMVARLTFVLGIRPIKSWGREPPIESMLRQKDQKQVGDRWFSTVVARDAAAALWSHALQFEPGEIVHISAAGVRTTRSRIARAVNPEANVQTVSHFFFEGIAARPYDTEYFAGQDSVGIVNTLYLLREEYRSREDMGLIQISKEIALFGGKTEEEVHDYLKQGFQPLHAEVTADFNRANPKTDEELLEWYRNTSAYIFELAAYHNDEGFNYKGMCKGFIEGLAGKGQLTILVLGDGIGTFSMMAAQRHLNVTYHDLSGSQTQKFAKFRFEANGLSIRENLTNDWNPPVMEDSSLDAIVSLDFFEHLPDVPNWVTACYKAIRPGGYIVAQNAFACGSGPEGSIPCHLAINDRYEKEWTPLMEGLGFEMESSNWWKKR